MKVLLLGSNGMLGQAIYKKFLSLGLEIYSAARDNADFCLDLADDIKLKKCICGLCPDIVINTVAIVDLGFCEANPGQAYLINTRIPGILTELCRRYNNYLVQISTDHYYCGDGTKKHSESDSVVLLNEYARTKYLGEQLVLTYKDSLVLRTNIVGFRGSKNPTLIEWAINELNKKTKLNLFIDFYTSSIYTEDFANVFVDVLQKRPQGVFNLASSEVNNKRDFIVGLSKALFNKEPEYTETSVKTITGARRAESLGLDTSKIEGLLGYKMPTFIDTMESIKRGYTERMKNNEV